ncbi:glycosyltransferase [Candidatus Uhrbacteria bacterium]|nr:glycosyltransferase [Candidatus Uhrbacteria bacterium]
MTKIAAIIPAYNEEMTIAQVVRPLYASPFIQEVTVVSDGSTDATSRTAREAGATVFELPHRGGKGEAMLYGLARTDAPIVVFFDADLIGLTPDHVERLVRPVLRGERTMNVGLRDRGRLLMSIMRRLPLISGERALLRTVMEEVDPRFLRGYMVEIALNEHCRARGLSYGAVELPGLHIRRKDQKVGVPRAVLQYFCMFYQVAKALLVVKVALRNLKPLESHS